MAEMAAIRPGRAGMAGFTLLELLAVVTIMSIVAYVAADSVATDTGQIRYHDTVARLKQLRAAVIGQPGRTINGEPDFQSFVADVGRLPNSLSELTERGTLTAWSVDATAAIGTGWNGPYLEVMREQSSGEMAFRDGWGNGAAAEESYSGQSAFAYNYGWRRFIVDSDALYVQSYGSDGIKDPTDTTAYDALDLFRRDYPPSADSTDPDGRPDPLVRARDYQVRVAAVSIRVRNVSTVATVSRTLCVRLHYPDTTGTRTSVASDSLTLPALDAGDQQTLDFTFPSTVTVTMGRRSITVHDSSGGSCPDIDSTSLMLSTARPIALVPPLASPTLDWTLP